MLRSSTTGADQLSPRRYLLAAFWCLNGDMKRKRTGWISVRKRSYRQGIDRSKAPSLAIAYHAMNNCDSIDKSKISNGCSSIHVCAAPGRSETSSLEGFCRSRADKASNRITKYENVSLEPHVPLRVQLICLSYF